MFKLTVVGGPSKGQSYAVKDGENSVGRVEGNDIVLSSQKVSKRHCVLVVSNDEITVKDAGSSNGIFVNGILTKLRKLVPGDRVSVGEYVLELSRSEPARRRVHLDNVVALHGGFRSGPGSAVQPVPVGVPGAQFGGQTGFVPPSVAAAGEGAASAAPPKTLKEKIQFYFDQYVINFVYNLNEKHEWRAMVTGMFVVLTAGASIVSVYPVLDRVEDKLAREAEGRAFLIARQVVDRNAAYIYEKMDSKVDVGFAEHEPGVLSAYVVDMEGRVLAPGRKLNQYITDASEAAFGAAARASFAAKEALERKSTLFGNTVGVAVPLRVFVSASGKNQTVALGLVFFDRNLIMFDPGTEALTYIQSLILSAIIGVIVFFSLYRLTLRPLLALNDDIDQVLKGSASSVSRRFKMEEINPLIDVVNAALQRVAQASPAGTLGGSGDSQPSEEVAGIVRFAADRMAGTGLMFFSGDRTILHINPFMEEVTGIRSDSAVGSPIGAVARDAAFAAFVDDALARAPAAGQEPLAEDFEFSGTSYRMECVAVGPPGAAKAYVLTARKPD